MSLLKHSQDMVPEPVEIKGETYHVIRMSALEKGKFDLHYSPYQKSVGGAGLRGFLTVWCLCDEHGEKTYSSGESDEPTKEFLDTVAKYNSLPLEVVEPAFEKACEINGFNVKEDTEKN